MTLTMAEPVTSAPAVPVLVIPATVLRSLVGSVAFACDRSSSSRYVTDAVLLRAAGREIVAVATDGIHAATRAAPSPTEIPEPIEVLIPRAHAQTIARWGSSVTGEATITLSRQVSIAWRAKGGSKEIVFDAPIGRFPSWESIVSGAMTAATCRVTAVVAELLADLPDPDDARFRFSFGAAKCSVAQPPATLLVKADGPDVVVDLDLRRLRSFLETLPEKESVTLHLTGESSPVGAVCGEVQYVLMPLCSEKSKRRK